ncbi:MAG TPA: DNA repair exonuclease [bacterium]|nr:DNA repair exonuclease [bacterium]
MLKFVHAADIHLDSPFVGLAEAAPDVQKLLCEATFKAFDNVIGLCLEEHVDFLLLAGDIYDAKDRSLRAQLRFSDGLKRLDEAGIRTFVVHGNHDPLDGWKANLKWPDRVHVFGAERVESVVYERDGEAQAIIHGVSFGKAEVRDNLAARFSRQDSPLFQVGLLHCNVGAASGHENYSPCTRQDLELSGLDYWALGHVHNRQILNERGPYVAYSGNTQGRHINESGPRGCFLVSVDDSGGVEARFVPTDVVRWQSADFSIEGIADIDGLIDEISRCLSDLHNASDGRPTICRLTITGRGPMHSELCNSSRQDEYLEEIRRIGASLAPAVFIADVRLSTGPDLDIDVRMKSQDIVGDCLRLVREHQTDGERLRELGGCLDELFNHRDVRRYLERFDDQAVIEMLQSAQSLLLDELLGAQE